MGRQATTSGNTRSALSVAVVAASAAAILIASLLYVSSRRRRRKRDEEGGADSTGLATPPPNEEGVAAVTKAFDAATEAVRSSATTKNNMTQGDRLLLYGLYKQSTKGDRNVPEVSFFGESWEEGAASDATQCDAMTGGPL